MAKKSTCKRCGKDFPSPQHLGGHIGIFKQHGTGCTPKKEPTSKEEHVCTVCGKGFPNAQGLGSHKETHKKLHIYPPDAKKALAEKKWSMMRLSRESGVSGNTARRIVLRGRGHHKNINKIAKALGIKVRRGVFKKSAPPSKKPNSFPTILVSKKAEANNGAIEIPINIKITVSVERS